MNFRLAFRSRKQLPPQKWSLRPGLVLKPMFPLPSSLLGQLQNSKKSFPYASKPERDMRILQKRRMLPCFSSGWCQSLHRLNTQKVSDLMKTGWYTYWNATKPSVSCLNRIFKEAKNLKSVALEPECGISNFKIIRKARGLQDLSIKIDTKTLVKYPQLFKRLPFLEKVKLYVKWSRKDSQNKIIYKFFESVLNLPRLQHITVWLDEGFDPSNWLDGDFMYFKVLLSALHMAKLSSFEIIACSASPAPSLQETLTDWSNYIETLYFGPTLTLDHPHQCKNPGALARKPEKRLRLNFPLFLNSKVDFESTTIKNLTIRSFFCEEQYHSPKNAKSLLTFLLR